MRVYWKRIHAYPARVPSDVRVILGKDWDAPPLERPEPYDAGWQFLDVEETDNDYIDAEVGERLGLCGDLHHASGIIDAMAIWGAISLAGVFRPVDPTDPVYGCDWKPEDIDDGGTSDEPSPLYQELQSAVALIWDSVAPGALTK